MFRVRGLGFKVEGFGIMAQMQKKFVEEISHQPGPKTY